MSQDPVGPQTSRPTIVPKKPMTSYFIYNLEQCKLLKSDDIKYKDCFKLVGEQWKTLTDEQKIPYNELAEKDKARYLDETKQLQD